MKKDFHSERHSSSTIIVKMDYQAADWVPAEIRVPFYKNFILHGMIDMK